MTPQRSWSCLLHALLLFLLFHLIGLKAMHRQHIHQSGEGETICPLSRESKGLWRAHEGCTQQHATAFLPSTDVSSHSSWPDEVRPHVPPSRETEHWRRRATRTHSATHITAFTPLRNVFSLTAAWSNELTSCQLRHAGA